MDGTQATLAEKAAVAKAKEAEVLRLRSQQERAADTQSQIDELRARRCALHATWSLEGCCIVCRGSLIAAPA